MKRSFITISILALLFCLIGWQGIASPPLVIGDDDSLYVSPWGMNAHLTFENSRGNVENLCKSLAECGVSVIRLDVYWWYETMFMQQDYCDQAVYYADKYGLEVLINFPQLPSRTDDKFFEEWLNMIKSYVQRYDGKTGIRVPNEAEVRYPKVKYFEALNEVEINYNRQNLSIKEVFKLIKESSNAIHSISLTEKPVVVFPGLGIFNDFMKQLFEYEENGKHVVDFIDVLNVHSYEPKTEGFISFMERWKERRKSYKCNDKPFWITELGNSLWDVSYEKQKENLEKQYILALAYGIERIFYYQYHSFGGNYFKTHVQKEEYFGIISPSISNSYVSFMENDGRYNRAISQGDGLKRIYIKKDVDSVSIYTINDVISNKLKDKGVAIGGKGYTIDSVSIYHFDFSSNVVWKGSRRIGASGRDYLCIDANKFRDISIDDKLIVYFSNPKDTTGKWSGVDVYPAYNAYKSLSSVLNKGCTRPVIKVKDRDVYIAKWKNIKNKKFYYALWTENKETKRIKLQSRPRSLRQIKVGRVCSYRKQGIDLKHIPIYFMSDNELLFE